MKYVYAVVHRSQDYDDETSIAAVFSSEAVARRFLDLNQKYCTEYTVEPWPLHDSFPEPPAGQQFFNVFVHDDHPGPAMPIIEGKDLLVGMTTPHDCNECDAAEEEIPLQQPYTNTTTWGRNAFKVGLWATDAGDARRKVGDRTAEIIAGMNLAAADKRPTDKDPYITCPHCGLQTRIVFDTPPQIARCEMCRSPIGAAAGETGREATA